MFDSKTFATKNYAFDMPTRVLFGPGALKGLHEEELPGKKALIAISHGGSMKRHGQLAALEEQLDQAGIAHVLYEGLRPNPTNTSVDEAVQMLHQNDCDFVVALGGGSTMDAGKAIALVAANGRKCWDYSFSSTGGQKTPEKAPLPLVVVTTSAGTGSEVDMWSVITNDATGEKTGYASMFPTMAVVDSDLMMSVPANFTAYQGMDAFYHASESVINVNEHPLGEMFALKAIELIAHNLPAAVADGGNVEARANMALANTLAGYYMLCTSEHTMEHALGSEHPRLVHGAGLIMISHEYFDFFAERKACEEQMIKMARVMGVPNPTSGKDFIGALDKLIADVKCADLKMSDNGITRDELPGVVKKYHEVLGGDITADPVHLTDEDVLGMFQRSYK